MYIFSIHLKKVFLGINKNSTYRARASLPGELSSSNKEHAKPLSEMYPTIPADGNVDLALIVSSFIPNALVASNTFEPPHPHLLPQRHGTMQACHNECAGRELTCCTALETGAKSNFPCQMRWKRRRTSECTSSPGQVGS